MATANQSLITTSVVVVSVVFPLLSAVAVYLRFKARRKTHQRLMADDLSLVPAWFLTVSLSVIVWVTSSISGIDYYKVDTATGIEYSLKCGFFSSLLSILARTVVKISILLFYKRLFQVQRAFVIGIWVFMTVISCYGLAVFFMNVFEIYPISGNWTGNGRDTLNLVAFGIAEVASSLVLDILILCLPIPIIIHLRMSMRSKIAVISTFWLGAFCCVAALVRVVVISQIIPEVADAFDLIYKMSLNYLFTIMEPNVAIIAACLPTFGALLKEGHTPHTVIPSTRSFWSLPGRNPTETEHSYASKQHRMGYKTTRDPEMDCKSHLKPPSSSQTASSVDINTMVGDSINMLDLHMARLGVIKATEGLDVL